jgi:hypothetical protein
MENHILTSVHTGAQWKNALIDNKGQGQLPHLAEIFAANLFSSSNSTSLNYFSSKWWMMADKRKALELIGKSIESLKSIPTPRPAIRADYCTNMALSIAHLTLAGCSGSEAQPRHQVR